MHSVMVAIIIVGFSVLFVGLMVSVGSDYPKDGLIIFLLGAILVFIPVTFFNKEVIQKENTTIEAGERWESERVHIQGLNLLDSDDVFHLGFKEGAYGDSYYTFYKQSENGYSLHQVRESQTELSPTLKAGESPYLAVYTQKFIETIPSMRWFLLETEPVVNIIEESIGSSGKWAVLYLPENVKIVEK